MTDKEKLRTVRKDPVFVLFSRFWLFTRFGSGSDFSRGSDSDQINPENRIQIPVQIRLSKGRIRFMLFLKVRIGKSEKKSFSNFR